MHGRGIEWEGHGRAGSCLNGNIEATHISMHWYTEGEVDLEKWRGRILTFTRPRTFTHGRLSSTLMQEYTV